MTTKKQKERENTKIEKNSPSLMDFVIYLIYCVYETAVVASSCCAHNYTFRYKYLRAENIEMHC